MSAYKKIADEFLDRAVLAGALFYQFDQQQTDYIVEKVFGAGFNNRVKLAKMAARETGIGIWQHKVIKNVVGTQLVYESIRHEKTVGVISEDRSSGMLEIAQPLGPIFGIIPVTNPTSTIMFKILISLKSRNPIIISPPRKAPESCGETVKICYEAALEAGAPEDCIQIVPETNRELTHEFMIHPRVALILATGGTGLVHAAYSSGNPALGVGPGNVPVFIDQSADIPFAVRNIIGSKTFDNGTICASEQAIVCEKSIAGKLKDEFIRQQCYFLSVDETKKIEAAVYNYEKGLMSGDVVGQSVQRIAAMAGIDVPEDTRIMIAEQQHVGRDYPLSQEILAPVLAFYEAPDYESAIKLCIDLNYLGGIGHTAGIYANDEERILEFSRIMNAGRIMVNTPSVQGAVGGIFNSLPTSLTLGCGSGGKNITTENVSARHLINVQRVCRRRENNKWFAFDQEIYLDENADKERILQMYHKNA
ncbi:MAG: aldehyde dehydrogenase family protein [Bacteroidales bacterium]